MPRESSPDVVRRACIDVGSNTTALLVADVAGRELRPVASERRFTLLGETPGGSAISREKIVEVSRAVIELADRARELGAETITLIGTQAVRNAVNRDELCEQVEASAGIPLQMIDGLAEGRYSCIGATGGLDRVSATTVVVDSGGGSTEISICQPGETPVTSTFGIGSARLRQLLLPDDPPSEEQLTRAREHADTVFDAFRPPTDLGVALVVGGGATTARRLMGGVIDEAGLRRATELCANSDASSVAERFGVDPERAALLPASLVVLASLTALLGVDLEVGRGGLREGVLLDQ